MDTHSYSKITQGTIEHLLPQVTELIATISEYFNDVLKLEGDFNRRVSQKLDDMGTLKRISRYKSLQKISVQVGFQHRLNRAIIRESIYDYRDEHGNNVYIPNHYDQLFKLEWTFGQLLRISPVSVEHYIESDKLRFLSRISNPFHFKSECDRKLENLKGAIERIVSDV